MSIRIEQFDGGDVLYIALDPDGVWARSEFPDELITVDYNAQGGVIGVEVIGSLAQHGVDVLFGSLLAAPQLVDPPAIRAALRDLVSAA